MQNIKQHIIYRVLALLLVVAVTVPSVIKLAHVFEEHEHQICTGEKQTHIHEIDIECEFYKFKLNNSYAFNCNEVEFISVENNHKTTDSQYQFIIDFQHLPFSLRGPPQLV